MSRLLSIVVFTVIMQNGHGQDWRPFYTNQRAYYTLDSDYLSDINNEIIGIPSDAVLGLNIESSKTEQGETSFYCHTIPSTDFEGECVDLIHWPGIIHHTANSWKSITHLGDTIHWPTTTVDTSLFMRIDTDSTILVIFEGQSWSGDSIVPDSVRSYKTILMIQGDSYPTDKLSNLRIVVGKNTGLQSLVLPFCFPTQTIEMKIDAIGKNGALNGFAMHRVYKYALGDQLHFKSEIEKGQYGAYTRIDELNERFERFTIIDSYVLEELDSLIYQARRELREKTTYISIENETITVSNETIDTLIWSNSTLPNFFVEKLPRGIDTTFQKMDIISKFEIIHDQNYEFREHVAPGFQVEYDTCGITFNPYYGSSKTTTIQEQFGIKSVYELHSPDFGKYEISEKTLVYFNGSDTTFGDPLPPLGVTDIEKKSPIVLYPNPAVSELSIESSAPLHSVTILNHLGQLIREEKLNNLLFQRIDVRMLASGMYLLQIDSELGTQQMKFIKQ